MLTQDPDRLSPPPSDWCVGEPPAQWDISLSTRLVEQLWRWLGRGERPANATDLPPLTPPSLRKAA